MVAFLNSYLAFVQGGGTPDQFAGLPINSGGGTGGTGAGTYAYGGGFTGGAGTRNFYSYGNALVSTAAPDTEFDADGAFVTDNSFFARTSATATAVEISGDQYGLIGRFTDGTFNVVNNSFTATPNSGFHYVVVGPTSGTLPSSGVIAYDLLGATSPTYGDGRTAPGSFAGTLNVDYGFGGYIANFNGTVTMPDTVYDFTSRSGISRRTGLTGLFQGNVTARSGTNCTSSCRILGNYALGGARPGDRFGINYFLEGSSFNISGAALYGAPGTYTTTGGGTGGGGSTAITPYSGTVTGLTVFQTRFGLPSTSLESYTNSRVVFDSAGLIQTYTNRLGSNAGSGSPLADPALEAGSIDGAIAWARFTDAPNNQGTLAHTGVHTIVGTPAVDIPTSGLVNYSLIGGTLPTTNEGTAAPGSFSGQLAIDFATRRVGVNLDVAIAQYRWNLSTAGGAANPANGGMLINAISSDYFASGLQVSGLNAASCTASCTGDIQGSLFGQGASHTGLVYRVLDGSFTARGSAVFAAPGAAGTPVARLGTLPAGGGFNPYAGTGGGGTFAPPVVPDIKIDEVPLPPVIAGGGTILAGDWGRWSVPATASAPGGATPIPTVDLAPGLQARHGAGDTSAPRLSREQANAVLRGWVRFDK